MAASKSEGEERGTACLTLDFRSLYDTELASDVVVDLDCRSDKSSLFAHRVVLIASSTYFASLFSGAWDPPPSGGNATSARHICVSSDESIDHMKMFFAFLYGREIELDLSCASPLLRLADFYGVDALMAQCLRFLEAVLHPQPTRCFALFEEHQRGPSPAGGAAASTRPSSAPPPPPQERLIALCSEVLARSFTEASAHSSFRHCPEELLVAVLERDDLSVDKEMEVAQARCPSPLPKPTNLT